ncbi:PfkB family carbohydrate kinase [Feifania hominis]|uniref:Carbohydrate kinase n=1 Tax=Feifania hominis TaxID=2763660 RepID=A0A926DDF0_9FIRM|nr:PfkB family carbohydrate kinase [Feifania hominis]MBC8535807.1 carbohydrate kinase [Feifania hominis]
MEKTYDIVALGECLVDFISTAQGEKLFLEGNPGGAPANVLAAASRLGRHTAFIGKLGDDGFGHFLNRALKQAGVGTGGVVFTKEHPTTLAMVTLDEDGNRDFSFYRERTADVMLRPEEIDWKLIETTRIFHFGSVSMTAEPSRGATLAAAQRAREAGAVVSFDPNLREPLWGSLEQAKESILQGMALADVVKLSGEELVFLTGGEGEAAMRQLAQQCDTKILTVTLAAQGCLCLAGGAFYESRTYDVKAIDTTGAGDAFWGAFLSRLTGAGIPGEQELLQILDFANAAGSLTTTRKGAIPAMPDEEQIRACMRSIAKA